MQRGLKRVQPGESVKFAGARHAQQGAAFCRQSGAIHGLRYPFPASLKPRKYQPKAAGLPRLFRSAAWPSRGSLLPAPSSSPEAAFRPVKPWPWLLIRPEARQPMTQPPAVGGTAAARAAPAPAAKPPTGAERLLRAAVEAGVEVCFANPGPIFGLNVWAGAVGG
jgi:hypothetical protein